MTLDRQEIEVVRLCLLRASAELHGHITGEGSYLQVRGLAQDACRRLRTDVTALLVRIQQEQIQPQEQSE
jgi:hypothetical protein